MSLKLKRPIGLVRPITGQPIPVRSEPQAAAPSSDSELLHPTEAAKRLHVSEHVLERWRSTGEGPSFVRLTRKTIRYRVEDLRAFVDNNLRISTAA